MMQRRLLRHIRALLPGVIIILRTCSSTSRTQTPPAAVIEAVSVRRVHVPKTATAMVSAMAHALAILGFMVPVAMKQSTH
tara:strand:- start:651 stop:890 length:240 start_codon:yes stop_codon:yes gene_type:complete